MTDLTDVVVIGAGAAGLMCAGFAARRGKSVVVLEKMDRPARKLMITGKGRCNLTNDCGRDALISAVRTNGRFLHGAFAAFAPQDMMRLMEDIGVPVKTERGNRVFPKSDRAADVVDALMRFARRGGAVIETGMRCGALLIEDGKVIGVKTSGGRELRAESVVIATGGKSYPATGSTGDGYRLAEQAGHTIADIRPSLIPIIIKEAFCGDLMGLSLRNCRLTLRKRGVAKPEFEEIGELLFTHFGISGPLALSASAHMDGDIEDWELSLDLKPGLILEQLDARILRDFNDSPNREFKTVLQSLLPRRLIPIMMRVSGIDGRVKINQITKEQRHGFAALLKDFTLTPVGFRPIEEAVVTSGGVRVKEIDPKTMRSKLVEGLYFAGEVIDVDAYTGGFNLQIAFSTGYAAGNSVC